MAKFKVDAKLYKNLWDIIKIKLDEEIILKYQIDHV